MAARTLPSMPTGLRSSTERLEAHDGARGRPGYAERVAPLVSTIRRRPFRTGLAGLLLAYLAVGLLHVVALPPFLLVDESAHVGHALAVSTFELPGIDTPIPTADFPLLRERVAHDVAIGRAHRADIWTATHPPLFYALTALPLRAGTELDSPLTGLLVARALNVAIGAGVLVATAVLTRRLVPARPAAALLAPAWLATLPLFLTQPAAVYNDVLALLAGTAALAAAVGMVARRRTTVWGVGAVAAWASAAALTRITGLVFAGVAVALTALAAASTGPASARARLARSLRDGGGVVTIVGLASGWFYWRNLTRYGGVSGRPGLLDKLDYGYEATIVDVLANPRFWDFNARDVFGGVLTQGFFADERFGMPDAAASDPATAIALLVGATALASLVLHPLLRLVAARPGGLSRSAATARRVVCTNLPGLACWAVILGAVSVIVLASADHVAAGGHAHGRYLMQLLPPASILAALAWTGVRARSRPSPTALPALGLLLAANLVLWGQFVSVHHGPGGGGLSGFLASVAALPAAPVLLPLAATALPVGIGLTVVGYKALTAPPPGHAADASPTEATPSDQPAGSVPSR